VIQDQEHTCFARVRLLPAGVCGDVHSVERSPPPVGSGVLGRNADRIRRILSDGAAAPPPSEPKLRQVERAPTPPAHEVEAVKLDDELRARLEALGVHTASSTPRPGRHALHGEPPARPEQPLPPGLLLHPPAEVFDWAEAPSPGTRQAPAALAGLVEASERETEHGSFLQVERRIPLTARHGGVVLGSALDHDIALRAHERGPCRRTSLDPRDAVFIDTETTGLAGGTGTVAFLVGAGWVEGDTFLVRQYFMRDYPDEGALLAALAADLGDRPLVSFNGRSFDWPLLTTRWQMHRSKQPRRAHLDLLPSARRLWSSTLHSHSLAVLERHVLHLERGEDLPGYLIPSAWFDFLRSGWGGTIAQAFRHNEIDVVSMLALFARVGTILQDPIHGVGAHGDRPGTAKLLMDLDQPERARHCLEAGLGTCDPDGAPFDERPLRRLLGHLCRRAADHEQALEHWQAVARAGSFDEEAYEHVAKIYEHRLKEPAQALTWTESALEQLVEGTRGYEAFAHRAARLRRRLVRANGPS